MAKRIIWVPEAETSFQSVIDYLEAEWSEREIQKFVEKVFSVIEHIRTHPFLYKSAGKEDIREAVITKHNILLYRVASDTIFLLYFWNTRRNPAVKPGFE